MSSQIAAALEILWSDFDDHDIDAKLEAFAHLKAVVNEADLPDLLDALKSEKSDFWVRELLSEPICELGGTKFLPELFEALHKNYDDGHDNDALHHFLTEIAWAEPNECRSALTSLIANPEFRYKESAKWLLEFCE